MLRPGKVYSLLVWHQPLTQFVRGQAVIICYLLPANTIHTQQIYRYYSLVSQSQTLTQKAGESGSVKLATAIKSGCVMVWTLSIMTVEVAGLK